MGAAQVRFVPTLAGQNHQRGGSQSLERMVRISSMNGPQSLELSVSITGIHTLLVAVVAVAGHQDSLPMRFPLVDLALLGAPVHDFEDREAEIPLTVSGLDAERLDQGLVPAVPGARILAPASPDAGVAVCFSDVEQAGLAVR